MHLMHPCVAAFGESSRGKGEGEGAETETPKLTHSIRHRDRDLESLISHKPNVARSWLLALDGSLISDA